MTKKKYLPILREINEIIEEFNSYLIQEFAVPILNISRINDNSYFLNPRGTKWETCPYPRNPNAGGVYFYMGSSEGINPELYIYVGKASCNATIGSCLNRHLKNKWDDYHIIKNGSKEKCFKVELISCIPFENKALIFLAPALEEFLINKLKQEYYSLLNRQGNY